MFSARWQVRTSNGTTPLIVEPPLSVPCIPPSSSSLGVFVLVFLLLFVHPLFPLLFLSQGSLLLECGQSSFFAFCLLWPTSIFPPPPSTVLLHLICVLSS